MRFPKWATTVTPLSKTLALILFIFLPILGFTLGMQYMQLVLSSQRDVPVVVLNAPSQMVSTTKLANPAAVFCVKQGGQSKIISAPDGSQEGTCTLPRGQTCDEWQFFRTKVCK